MAVRRTGPDSRKVTRGPFSILHFSTSHKGILKERTIMRKRFLGPRILSLLIAVAALLAAQAQALAQDKAAKIDELMKVYNSYQQFNGAVLVAENAKVIFKKGYGM